MCLLVYRTSREFAGVRSRGLGSQPVPVPGVGLRCSGCVLGAQVASLVPVPWSWSALLWWSVGGLGANLCPRALELVRVALVAFRGLW